ncbi:protein SMAX1-LIKE 6 [Prosopis cineraria]|uniref:protein SMAX1-LIKE 6 n=1 Tax=Prosopis cineraria TaxID=364024 RepID=UPI0024109AB7|nr:protein SMAX1-LIKE 6 [Prosopis cineraria]
MPTPVGVAKQCLTPDASRALDEAVYVARRRGHPQTTSLHAVSALLSLPSSTLRDACARARNCAYSPRLQFKALELCLSVSLDRVPSSQLADDPPVSNSLMAAIKRSQASQRRQPDNFHIYHQITQQPSSVSCVKVELQHLILSILDDPVVSRVFGEAGFRSSEIKLAVLRPLPQLLRYSRSRVPPIFLCNLTEHPDPGRRSFSFPFPGSFGTCDGGAENYKRIGDVLCRSRGRNPLLLGVCADDALRSFTEDVNKQRDGALPAVLSGLHVICIGKDISKFVFENFDNETISSRLEEIAEMEEQGVEPGLVVNFGDLKPLVDDNASNEAVNHIVAGLAKLLQLNHGKFWLMGAAASYESYLKFMGRFPSIEKDWDLQLLPISSTRPPGESYQRPKYSLMDSFVPFGGLFSSPSDLKDPLHGSYYCVPRCLQCGESCVQEVLPASNARQSTSAVDPYQSNLPQWLQIANLGITKGLNDKTKEDSFLLDNNESGPIKKLDKRCQHPHNTQQCPEAIPCHTVVSSQCSDGKNDDVDNQSNKNSDVSPSVHIDLNSSMPNEEHMISASQLSSPVPVVSEAKQDKNTSKALEMFQKAKDLESGNLRSCDMSNSSVGDGSQLSPTSVASVTTDLGIGIYFSPRSNKSKKPTVGGPKEIPSPLSSNFNLVNRDILMRPAQSSSCLSSDHSGQCDTRNPKILFEALAKKVPWQNEALQSIVKTIAYCESSRGKCLGTNRQGGMWMNFVGPDRIGKKKIALSLAEILYGSQESFIFVDLNSEETNGHDLKFRGKTTLDLLVGELCKNPLSVVFLDNVDKADVMVQNSLSQAIKTGKIIDSCGREVGVNNAIIVTSFSVQQDDCTPKIEFCYSEERISRTKGVPIKIKVEGDIRSPCLPVVECSTEDIPNPILANKRKLGSDNFLNGQHKTSEMAKRGHKISNCFLDLNMPAEENELQFKDDGNPEGVSTGTQNPWLQDLYKQVDETIILKPYNFDALAGRVLKIIRRSFHKILGSECSLQIESEVMEQLLAAAYVLEGDMEVQDWVEQVLSGGFKEIQRRYSLSARSTVKLTTCQEQVPGVCLLPPRIIVD